MKRLLLALLFCGLGLNVFAAQNYEVKISGMTCGSCVESVESALKKLKLGNGHVEVSLEKKSAVINVANIDAKTQKAITDAVEAAGFHVEFPAEASGAKKVN